MGGGGGGGMGQMITNVASSVANVGAGWFASRQLNRGAAAQRDAQTGANALYQDLYGQTQADYAPYQEGGRQAWDALLKTYGIGGAQPDYSGFESSPDFVFARDQGINALDRSAAAKGRLYSGAQMKGLADFSSGLASQNLDSYRRGLYNISGQGLNATNALTNYRAGYGNQLGQGMVNMGDIEMARRLGRANINYRNVAAQDSIWGSGAGQQGGGNQNALNYGGGGGQSQFGGGQQGAGWNGNNWNQNGYNYGSVANNFNWGG